jgi:protease II
MGKDVNEFVRKYGAPTASFSLPNGNTFYSYRTEREETYKQPTYINDSRNDRGDKETVISGGNTSIDRDFCVIDVEFDRSGKILTWRYEGDSRKHCKIKSLSKTTQKQLKKDGLLR